LLRPPDGRLSRPSRHPTEFLTASLIPPLNDSRAPSPTSSTTGPTIPGRPCRFGSGASGTTPMQCHARAVIGGVALEPTNSTAERVRQSRLEAQATRGTGLSHFEPHLRHWMPSTHQRPRPPPPPLPPVACNAGMVAHSHSPGKDPKAWCARCYQSVIPSLIAGLGSLVS
ncbi:hypothetical protein CORC01_06708, partial [Colletotrichum orchidophilum]